MKSDQKYSCRNEGYRSHSIKQQYVYLVLIVDRVLFPALGFVAMQYPYRILVLATTLSALLLPSSQLSAADKDIGAEAAKKIKPVPPKTTDQALASFETIDGFEMQLVASEPQIQEPIVIKYDEDGLLYVAEYLKFPWDGKKGGEVNGRIRLLRDDDGNGHYEKSTVFADDIAWPTGICSWKGGVFVIASPDLWYLKDTSGDGVADVKRKIYTGFGFTTEEGTANNLIWGLDNWIHCAAGGHHARPPRDPNRTARPQLGRPVD